MKPATPSRSAIWRRPKVIALSTLVLLMLAVASALVFFNARPGTDVDSPAVLYQQDAAKRAGLHAVFLGTSTFVLTDGTSSIMTDGFFSRPSFLQLLTSIKTDASAIDFGLSKAPKRIDAIFVAHAHHDHAMDTGLVAMKTNAVIYGSSSALNVARGQGTPESQLRVLKTGVPLVIGDFHVTAIETPHSPSPPNPGSIAQPVHSPAKLSDYQAGESFSFFVEHPLGKVLIVPSANYRVGAFAGLKVDIVVLGIGTLGKQSNEFSETYWNEVVRKTGAKMVIPVHWDDFTKPLRDPFVPLPFFMDNLSTSMERLRSMARRDAVEIRFLPPLREVTLPAGG